MLGLRKVAAAVLVPLVSALVLGPVPSGSAAPSSGVSAPPLAAGVAVSETFARPAGTTITFGGHGYGHGRGMSQWGAYGAATRGLTWQAIGDFYYPGTTRTWQGNPGVWVLLQDVGTSAVTVERASGLRFSDGSTTVTLSSAPARWRVVPESGGMTLQWLSGSVWVSSTWWRAWTKSPFSFSNPTSRTVRTVLPSGVRRDYRDTVVARPSGSGVVAINQVSTEAYLWSVVPSEMPASWSAQGLRAQAVAARTYSAWDRAHPKASTYDTCDTTACQRYTGVADIATNGTVTRREDSRTTDAVSATAGTVLRYGGAAAFTQFSASSGGITAAGGQPYLPAKSDPYDAVVQSASNPHTWSATLAISAIEKAYPTIGTLRSLVITSRTGGGDWGGRTAGVRVTGSSTSVSVTGDAFRMKMGLRSTWWAMTSPPARSAPTFPKDLTADSLADLTAIDGSGRLLVLKNSGSSTFTPVVATSGGWGSAALVTAVGPMDSDNLGDVVARLSDGSVWLYRGGTTGALTRGAVRIATGWQKVSQLIAVGDLSGDGKTDLVARWSDGRLVLYRGTGAGALASSAVIGTGWGVFASTVSTGDVSGDGRPDILGLRASDGRMFLYRGTAGGVSAGVPLGTLDWRPRGAVRAVGNLAGDSRPDLIARASNGRLSVYPGTGSGTFGGAVGFGSTSYTRLGF